MSKKERMEENTSQWRKKNRQWKKKKRLDIDGTIFISRIEEVREEVWEVIWR